MGLESIALGSVIGGTAIGAAGSLLEGQARSAAADYNAALLARNAKIASAQADADAEDKAREGRRYLGTLQAAFGASGLAMEGSVLDIYEDQALEINLARERVLYAGELRALGLESDAEVQKAASKAASTAGIIGAMAQVGQGAGSYYRLKAAGVRRSGADPEL